MTEPGHGQMDSINPSQWIAHRGLPKRYPENAIAGFQAALRAGAQWLETDVHITADGVPILSHDPTLQRIAGQDWVISKQHYADIAQLLAVQTSHSIARLQEFADLLSDNPSAKAFIELKPEAWRAFGSRGISIILDALAGVEGQCVFISFIAESLEELRRLRPLPVGWILPEWSKRIQAEAVLLQPEYLFINRARLPADESLWPGAWRWVVYTISSRQECAEYKRRGFDLFETDEIESMLQLDRISHQNDKPSLDL